jgi:UPF0716 family protein affecting phage T7 exclusion
MRELVPNVHELLIRMLIGVPATVALIAMLATVGSFIATRRGWRS